MINISPAVREGLLVFLPFLNEISGVISDSVPPGSMLHKFYEGNVKMIIDYIVLVSICWTVAVTTNKKGVTDGVIKGALTLLLAFIIPNLFMERVIELAGPKSGTLVKFIVGFSFITVLVILEKLLWEFYNAEEVSVVETFTESIKKDVDKTEIRVVVHKWSDDFSYRYKNHEPEENKEMCHLLDKLKSGTYIIDVGGHVGDTGLYLAKCIKDRNLHINVVIIEPDLTKIDFISRMAQLNDFDNVTVINKAAGSKTENGELDKEASPGLWEVIKGETGKKDNDPIEIDTLDNIMVDKEVSMIHLDVGGTEHDVILGAKRVLGEAKHLMIELNGKDTREKTRKILGKNGFKKVTDAGFENGNVLYSK